MGRSRQDEDSEACHWIIMEVTQTPVPDASLLKWNQWQVTSRFSSSSKFLCVEWQCYISQILSPSLCTYPEFYNKIQQEVTERENADVFFSLTSTTPSFLLNVFRLKAAVVPQLANFSPSNSVHPPHLCVDQQIQPVDRLDDSDHISLTQKLWEVINISAIHRTNGDCHVYFLVQGAFILIALYTCNVTFGVWTNTAT